jgi:hypothetical protein
LLVYPGVYCKYLFKPTEVRGVDSFYPLGSFFFFASEIALLLSLRGPNGNVSAAGNSNNARVGFKIKLTKITSHIKD